MFASRTIPSFDGDHDDGDVDHDVGGGDHDVGDDENAPFILEDNISHVIVRYEGSYFPGIVKQVRKTTTRVSCMIKCGPSTWKWPEVEDILDYDPDDIIKAINPPKPTNKRGMFKVAELEKYQLT